ncbi:linear amide C-N hydrolase [Xanthobacter variabilis]|uniref:linear amide C-N hydrolase n=1 Tax=Xanthobacter variabilis TaxID=3119932 RepID=UPI0037294B61
MAGAEMFATKTRVAKIFASRFRPSALTLALFAAFALLALLTPHTGVDAVVACTALLYRDNKGGVYAGRTLELPMELPYLLTYLPAGRKVSSAVPGRDPLVFETRHAIVGITVPNGTVADLKLVEGVNEKGLTFSLLAFADAAGPAVSFQKTKAALAAIDLGVWTLGLFETTDQVKTALAAQPVLLSALEALHGARTPFHFIVHDQAGGSLVIEFADGKQNVYDNPIGVMTNGPDFPWHLTNMNNYSYLTNLDRSSGTFGKLNVRQPDSGIATAGLPASNTAVGRFVRAAYYAQYAERAAPEAALSALAHVMNNFDRPKGITVDPRGAGGLEVEGAEPDGEADTTTEYTSWTSLTDLAGGRFLVRTYAGMNYVSLDFAALKGADEVKALPLNAVGALPVANVAAELLAAKLG